MKDVDGVRYTAVNMVDMGTSFQQVALIKSGGGNPSARQCLNAFMERWVSWAGHPQQVVVDRGTRFKGEFAQYMAQHGIHLRNAPLESPQTIGKVERHGGLLKALIRKTVQEIQPSSRKVPRAMQRNAAPMDMEYQVGDLVIYRRDNLPGSTATVWQTASRVIGREAEKRMLTGCYMRVCQCLSMQEK